MKHLSNQNGSSPPSDFFKRYSCTPKTELLVYSLIVVGTTKLSCMADITCPTCGARHCTCLAERKPVTVPAHETLPLLRGTVKIKKGDRVRIMRHCKSGSTETFEAHVCWDAEDHGDHFSFGFIPVLEGSNKCDHNHCFVSAIRVYKPGVEVPGFAATVELIPSLPIYTGTSAERNLGNDSLPPVIHHGDPACKS
jgi:hypothetical protein